MASKSKRRGRVFRASCILAALIIAGSSFAWFTSSDEVTNRLTASSDYGVSIVESFTPPKNWLPGEEVNKDVYAVNTGNVDAFVKETVSGIINYTFEAEVDGWDSGCLTLDKNNVTAIDGATTNEGGGFLAWTDAPGVRTGAINSVRNEDDPNFVDPTWHPTVSGVYVFRRSITHNENDVDTYTYGAYYYDSGTQKYYKVVLGNDTFRATQDGTNWVFDIYTDQSNMKEADGTTAITVDSDTGLITSDTLKYAFVKEGTVKDADVEFTYDSTNKRLVIEVERPVGVAGDGTVLYSQDAILARLEVDMKNKEEESKEKTADYDWAKAQYDYATALATARNNLADALAEVKAAYQAKTNADSAMTTATSNVNSKATTMESGNYTTINNAKTSMDPLTAGHLLTTNQIEVGTNNDYPKAKANYTTLCNTYNAIFTDTPSDSLMKQILEKLDEIEADTAAIPSLTDDTKVARVVADASALKTLVDSLVTNLDTYEKTFANFVDDDLQEAGVTPGTTAGKKADIHALLTAAKALQTEAADLVTLASTYNTKYTDYKDKNKAYDNDIAPLGELQQWGEALTAYNDAVKGTASGARYTFNGVVTDINGRGIFKSHEAGTYHNDADKYVVAEANVAKPIVKNYSANPADDNLDPTITWTQTGFDGYTLDKVALPTESAFSLPTLLNAKNNAARVYANAQTAYNNAESNTPAAAGTNLKLYVNLADGYDDDWQLDNRTSGTTDVDFYLKKVLKAGETSGQLIDSVTMDSSVDVNTYKNFQFDLNVGLDSIQVAYDADQNGYDPKTANASDNFKMTAATTAGSDAVTWTAT